MRQRQLVRSDLEDSAIGLKSKGISNFAVRRKMWAK